MSRVRGAVAVIVVVTIACLWWSHVRAPRAQGIEAIGASTPTAAAAPQATAREVAPSLLPVASEPLLPPTSRSAALTPREWAAVQERSAAASHPEQEAQRMAGYIAFQKTYLAWRALARGDDPAVRDALGQQLLDGLAAHVQQGDVAIEQARSVQEEVLTARIPDAAQRAPLLASEHQRLPAPAEAAASAPPTQAFH